VLVLSVINWTYCNWTGIHQIWQIRLEIWPKMEMGTFSMNGQIQDLPKTKSGTHLVERYSPMIMYVDRHVMWHYLPKDQCWVAGTGNDMIFFCVDCKRPDCSVVITHFQWLQALAGLHVPQLQHPTKITATQPQLLVSKQVNRHSESTVSESEADRLAWWNC